MHTLRTGEMSWLLCLAYHQFRIGPFVMNFGYVYALSHREGHAIAAQPWLQPGEAPARGVVVTNPPYGMRVKGRSPLRPLYQTLGHRVKRMGPGWRAAVLAQVIGAR